MRFSAILSLPFVFYFLIKDAVLFGGCNSGIGRNESPSFLQTAVFDPPGEPLLCHRNNLKGHSTE